MAAKLTGRTQPRLWTPPLRPLNRRTSLGYSLIDFSEAIGQPLLPFQRWLAVHGNELLPDRSFRFKTVVVLVARQQGKTKFMQNLILHRMLIMGAPLVLGVSADLSLSRENWKQTVATVSSNPLLLPARENVRTANGDETLLLRPFGDGNGNTLGGRYKIAASNRTAGRGLSIDLLHVDEVREWKDWEPWAALQPTTAARPNSQVWCTSNAGDNRSVVLSALRESALTGRDPSIGLFEWSAPPGSEMDDMDAIRQACPGLGYTVSQRSIEAARATMPPGRFRTEYLCDWVDVLEGAIDDAAWAECADATAGPMNARRREVHACFDCSPDGEHSTLAVAMRLPDGRVRVELAGAWDDVAQARAELGPLLDRIRPRTIGWYAGSSPAGAYASILRARPGSTELTGSRVSEISMEFASIVQARRVLHGGEPVLDAHVATATRLTTSDGWRYGRKGHDPVDALYAVSGAASLALAQPLPARATIRILSAR